ncbi:MULTISPECIES: hypothetical protein [Paenibacillus]|uniref:hypothetical protein n=1 Tax=Paenibacillus TaxID=44249 RepID=UPI00105A7F1C|nr:hypothetical protein [Paenibacillus amylolyticus]TDL65614.1 hypothetical protein E2R58_19310 [Paenibacillus amylolyticus]UOK63559.1 hypothetical protein MT997_01860 [Paenibacillus sp. OVF10]
MKSKRSKQIKVVFAIILIIILLEQIPYVQKQTAVFSSKVYVLSKYGTNFKYKNIEYSPQFGNYDVFYRDMNKSEYSFTVTPRFFPVFVIYDSIEKQALELKNIDLLRKLQY